MADDKTPKHYLNKKGQDLFDEWHDRVSMDVMREIMRFTSERYVRRYDRKNGIPYSIDAGNDELSVHVSFSEFKTT